MVPHKLNKAHESYEDIEPNQNHGQILWVMGQTLDWQEMKSGKLRLTDVGTASHYVLSICYLLLAANLQNNFQTSKHL